MIKSKHVLLLFIFIALFIGWCKLIGCGESSKTPDPIVDESKELSVECKDLVEDICSEIKLSTCEVMRETIKENAALNCNILLTGGKEILLLRMKNTEIQQFMPEKEKQFISLVESFSNKYKEESNKFKQSLICQDRAKEALVFFDNNYQDYKNRGDGFILNMFKFENWIGILQSSKIYNNKAYIEIYFGGITVETISIDLSENVELLKKLSVISENAPVKFSGTFTPQSVNNKECSRFNIELTDISTDISK